MIYLKGWLKLAMYDNHLSLININYKEYLTILLVPIIFILLLVLSLTLESSDKLKVRYVYSNNLFTITVPIENSDNIIAADYLLLDNKKYKFNINNIENDLINNYQIIDVEIQTTKIDNQVGTIIFSFNKEKIIKKVIKLLF